MKTVPLADSSGTLPLRASKNPVLGVFRHHCGELASVHQPQGRRSKTRYLICDNCGTDQCGGKPYQEKIKANTYASIEALQAAENAVHTVKEVVEIDEPKATDSLSDNQAETLSDAQPLQAKPHLAKTVEHHAENNDSLLTDEITAIKPPQAAPDVAPTVKSIAQAVEPKLNDQPQSPREDSAKPMRVGFAAVLGGLIGGLLAAVA